MFELTTLTDYSDESLLAEMRRVASEFRGPKLTLEEFDRLSRVKSSTLRRRFGSWPKALDAAGISEALAPRPKRISDAVLRQAVQDYVAEHQTTPTAQEIAERTGFDTATIGRCIGGWRNFMKELGLQQVPLGRRYNDDECYENLLMLWTHYGRQPHFDELKRPPSRVGPKAYIRRWGGWRATLAAFVNYVDRQDLQEEEKSVPLPLSLSQLPSTEPLANEPRSLSLSLRYKVLCRDRFRCQICGRSPAKDIGVELHVDHILPWSKGGKNTEENLRTLCFDCNLGKGAKLETIEDCATN